MRHKNSEELQHFTEKISKFERGNQEKPRKSYLQEKQKIDDNQLETKKNFRLASNQDNTHLIIASENQAQP